MARKAVQGYSEKSYYDNTRFNSILATNDPLNEGYFRHLVNFDISDTGQSITPRKGYLATSLVDGDSLVALSNNSISFRDNNLQAYVLYDITNDKGYIANISAYNLEDKLIPVSTSIPSNRVFNNWDSVAEFLVQEHPYIAEYYASVQDPETTVRLRITYNYVIRPYLKVVSLTQPVVDMYGIRKNVFKAVLSIPKEIYDVEDYKFFVEVYYREDTNTLIFESVNTLQHPTYVPTERNIASPKSIVPEVMQNVYTTANRPASHVSNVGPIMYVKNTEGKYMINHVYKEHHYTFTPHFDLSPAHIAYGSGDSTNVHWAYKFDIVSTKRTNITELDNTVFRSTWAKYTNDTTMPTRLFNEVTEEVDLDNSTYVLRHYKGAPIVISLVPRYANRPRHIYNFTNPNLDETPDPTETGLALEYSRYSNWKNIIQDVDSLETLREALDTFIAANDTLFYVRDLRREYTTYKNGFEFVPTTNNIIFEPEEPHTPAESNSYGDYFLTAQDLIRMCNAGTFNEASIAFQLLPQAVTMEYITSLGRYFKWHFSCGPSDIASVYNQYEMDMMYVQHNFYTAGKVGAFFKSYEDSNDITRYMLQMDTQDISLYVSLARLAREGFFESGYHIIFYMRPYHVDELQNKNEIELNNLSDVWSATAPHIVNMSVTYGYDDLMVTTIPEVLTVEPRHIQLSEKFIVFEDERLVVWYGNTLYISEPGSYFYFKEESKKEFGERIVKVIQYKNIILVFTVQHLYAVYVAVVESVVTNDKGEETTISHTAWAKQTVLYNIMASDKYADVIQIFNQMVLFYSEDGQMFMIKPSTTIDSETRFTLQYFNKSVNDILLNYDNYINERLENYNIEERVTKEQVQIKSLVSVNFIKIFYYVPGLITYVLIYDVINNRYNVYDTIVFTDIKDRMFIESGDLYVTSHNDSLQFTFPYTEINQMDNIADMSVVNNFKKVAISCLLDTGNLNLNNHLNKRFRELYIVFKNLSTSKLLFNIETVLDGVVARPYYDTRLEVQDIGGTSYFVSVPKSNHNDIIELIDTHKVSEAANNALLYALNNNLFEEQNLLMDFSAHTSNKIITHKASILGMGKVFRLKMQFISKGAYKIQNYGIIYKERRI